MIEIEERKTIIYYFDSLGMNNPRCMEIIKQYLINEYAQRFGNSYLKEQLENNKVYQTNVNNYFKEEDYVPIQTKKEAKFINEKTNKINVL